MDNPFFKKIILHIELSNTECGHCTMVVNKVVGVPVVFFFFFCDADNMIGTLQNAKAEPQFQYCFVVVFFFFFLPAHFWCIAAA